MLGQPCGSEASWVGSYETLVQTRGHSEARSQRQLLQRSSMFPGEPSNTAAGISALGARAPLPPTASSRGFSPRPTPGSNNPLSNSPQVTHGDGASKELPLAHSAWNPQNLSIIPLIPAVASFEGM